MYVKYNAPKLRFGALYPYRTWKTHVRIKKRRLYLRFFIFGSILFYILYLRYRISSLRLLS